MIIARIVFYTIESLRNKKISIFDTTLRDGEQTAWRYRLRFDEKLLIAQQLDKLGVDIIEAGFSYVIRWGKSICQENCGCRIEPSGMRTGKGHKIRYRYLP